jgi:hypothetical protein
MKNKNYLTFFFLLLMVSGASFNVKDISSQIRKKFIQDPDPGSRV